MDSKKIILTYGTFDILHYGHIRLLRQSKELGDFLIVGLSTDEFCLEKGKETYYKYPFRKEMLEAIKYVDMVIPENSFNQKFDDIIKYGVDTIAFGSDIKNHPNLENINDYCNIHFFERTKDISTTQLKRHLH